VVGRRSPRWNHAVQHSPEAVPDDTHDRCPAPRTAKHRPGRSKQRPMQGGQLQFPDRPHTAQRHALPRPARECPVCPIASSIPGNPLLTRDSTASDAELGHPLPIPDLPEVPEPRSPEKRSPSAGRRARGHDTPYFASTLIRFPITSVVAPQTCSKRPIAPPIGRPKIVNSVL
jgi:hypothetical protein